jgi:RimJ/RimL family protein N-acetyltransferase
MTFLPENFDPPERLETERFRLRPIAVHDVVKDYDAVMTSREHLWAMFGEVWGWPPASLTLEEDLIDLAWHQKEGEIKSSFNYAVMSLDEKRLLGCVYIDPSDKADAEVAFWVRKDEMDTGLEKALDEAVREWISSEWPFESVLYPGRDMTWEEVASLPDRSG